MNFGSDRRFELSDGVIQMMTGGSSFHSRVAGNLYVALRSRLPATCRVFNSDMGVRISDTTVRYPGLSVVCRRDWLREPDVLAFDDPRVIVEVLSPSTTTFDQGTKRLEYVTLDSVEAVVFVDPVNRLTRVHHRVIEGWTDSTFAALHEIELPGLDLVIPEAEIFAA